MNAEVAVALGSNRGDRVRTLESAVASLARRLDVVAVSPWLENPAVGGPPGQPDYLNGVLLGSTRLAPKALLAFLMEVEAEHGRDRASEGRNGARTLDLDLLVYGDLVHCDGELEVPHPRMLERDFVLVPLALVAPRLRLPHTRRTAREELHRLAERRPFESNPSVLLSETSGRPSAARWAIESAASTE